jgi:hypothetical protein
MLPILWEDWASLMIASGSRKLIAILRNVWMVWVVRRVSMILRHPAWEFTDFLPLSFSPVEVVC